jgi:hypothetical protein
MLAALLLPSLSACSNGFTGTDSPAGTAAQVCRTWETIRPSRKDVLTQGTAEQIAGNNVAREQWCTPPPRFASVTSRT